MDESAEQTEPNNPDALQDPKPWECLQSEPGPDLIICRARFDEMRNPRTGQAMRRTVLETPDWVNVVALTPDRELVVVRQFRFGPRLITTEIPGGVVDPGEFHGDAAKRELREETGYTSKRWTALGSVEPNPAFHDNTCFHWLAEDAELTDEMEQDPGEDIRVGLLSEAAARDEIASGRMRHSLVIAALARVLDLRPGAF